jgi:hypothetical protein
MEMPSPSMATAISVRFLFFVPLILQTLAASGRPSLLLIAACGSDANVKGAPISLANDMILPDRVSRGLRAWLIACDKLVEAP